MSAGLKIAAGLVCFALGLGYLYRPDLIARLNALIREYLLNDAHIALERGKWGMFFMLLAFLFLYMGITALGWHP
ncbi:MAG: hypothetical protein KGO96_04230 [Elusimicrobia bacterium]|nr:hypothetical protein [Elusimicrobiota bacterium]MDE2237494.1 hypothetical protein [Elusimicrobiota bacterium]MDE2425101.1 hypothetical protein [Elusimicrobiota bacterium]